MRVKLTAIALATVLLLAGCSFGGNNPGVDALAGKLGAMPGVASAVGDWTPGSLNFRASASINVDLEPDVTADKLLAVIGYWNENADFGKSASGLSLGFQDRPSITLGLDHDNAPAEALDTVVPLWLQLGDSYDVANVEVGPDGTDLFLRSGAMNSPGEAATTVRGLEQFGAAELETSTWFIGPMTADGDSNDEVGVSVTSTQGLPDAAALDYLAGFDSPFLSAANSGEVFLGFEEGDAGAHRIAVTLSPDSLRDTPSNQLNDGLVDSAAWQTALDFARVVQPSDSSTISIALFRNPAFATLSPADCSTSRESTELGDQLWQAWLSFGSTPDGSTSLSCG